MWSVVAVIVVVNIVIVVVARSHIHALVIEVRACLSVGLLHSICRIIFYLSFTFLSLFLSSSQCVLLPLSSSPPFIHSFVEHLHCDCVPFIKICQECLSHNRTKPEPSNQVDFLITGRVCIESDFLEWKSIAFCVWAWLYRAINLKCMLLSISKGSPKNWKPKFTGFNAFNKWNIFLITSCIMPNALSSSCLPNRRSFEIGCIFFKKLNLFSNSFVTTKKVISWMLVTTFSTSPNEFLVKYTTLARQWWDLLLRPFFVRILAQWIYSSTKWNPSFPFLSMLCVDTVPNCSICSRLPCNRY